MVRTVAIIVAFGAIVLAGCAPRKPDSETTTAPQQAVENVVARVGDRAIGASDVRARMAAEGLDAEGALQQLVDEELLLSEARRLGFSEDRQTKRALERQMVRAMLRDLEAQNTPASITVEELREDFALHREKLQVPERRRSWHILVREPGDAGRLQAESILRDLRTAKEPRSVFDRYAADGSAELKAEELPPITRKASIEKPYLDAVFEAESEGLIDRVVKTSYGWHAIFVAEIQPAERRTLADVEEESRERLSQKKRFERLNAIIQGLEADGLVELEEEMVERLVSAKGLPQPAPK